MTRYHRGPRWLALLGLVPSLALAALPARNLCVELREASVAAPGAGWQVSSADARAVRDRAPQRLCMQNGEVATLALDLTRPVQVWQAAQGVALPVAVPTTQWMHAGQRLSVRPRWDGGREPVKVELAAHASHFDRVVAPGSGESPSRTAVEIETTLRAPLGAWITIASTGETADDANVVASSQARPGRVLQMRVELVP